MNNSTKDYPKDMKDIIRYTKLRKQYPEIDKKIREQKRYKEPLKPAQMNQLIQILKKENPQCNN